MDLSSVLLMTEFAKDNLPNTYVHQSVIPYTQTLTCNNIIIEVH